MSDNSAQSPAQTQPLQIRQVPVSNAWAWIVSGFEIFKAYPVMWIVLFVIYLVIVIPLSMIPLFGQFLGFLIAPVFAAGMMMGCLAIKQRQELEINHLFAGFKQNTAQLVLVGALYLAAILLVLMVITMNLDQTVVDSIVKGQAITPAQLVSTMKPAIYIALLWLVPVMMAYWFAPLLVRLHNLSAMDAMKMSLKAVWHNILPVLLYMLIFLGLFILGAIPYGIGLLVVLPVMITSTYTSYLDIFSIQKN